MGTRFRQLPHLTVFRRAMSPPLQQHITELGVMGEAGAGGERERAEGKRGSNASGSWWGAGEMKRGGAEAGMWLGNPLRMRQATGGPVLGNERLSHSLLCHPPK